jgi:hypothetical protein
MKKSILVLAALAAIFSCSKENPSSDNYAAETFAVELTASAPSVNNGNGAAPANAMTKTTLIDGQNSKLVHWSKGDAIKVLFFPGRHDDVISGPSGVLTSYFETESSASANFRTTSWSFGIDQDRLSSRLQEVGVAVYPSTAVATSSKGSGKYTANTTEVSFNLPSEQNAVENNIEPGLNFSYASISLSSFVNTVNTGAPTELYFNNACAMIELTMPSELPAVTSISIESNTDVPLTGKGVANLSYYNDAIDSNSRDSVTDNIFVASNITGGAGVTLNNPSGFKAGAKYYAVVWPGIHNSGLTITFTAQDGTAAVKTTPAVTLTPSVVKPYTFSKGLEFAAPQKDYNYYYANGEMGDDPNPAGTSVVGVIVYHGDPRSQFKDSDLPTDYNHGLAVSVKTYSTKWHTSQPSTSNGNIKISSNANLPSYNKGGYTVKNIWASEGISLNIYNASNYDALNGNTSGWYHGTPLEWKYICENLSEINALLSQVPGAVQIAPSNNAEYALPLYYYSTKNWTFYINGGALTYKAFGYNFTSDAQTVRPIFAF